MMRGLVRAAYEYNWSEAGDDFARALTMNPAFSLAYNRRAVWYLHPLGRLDEALSLTKRGLELDPLSLVLRISEAFLLHSMGNGPEAIRTAREVLRLFPNFWLACFLCGTVLTAQGLHEETDAVVRKGLEIDPGNVHLLAYMGYNLGQQGKLEEAKRVLAQLEALPRTQYVSSCAMAIAAAGCGDLDGSFRWLEKAVEEREPMAVILFRNPLLAAAQSHPRYPDLLRKMNL